MSEYQFTRADYREARILAEEAHLKNYARYLHELVLQMTRDFIRRSAKPEPPLLLTYDKSK